METAATSQLPCAYCRGTGAAPHALPGDPPHCEVCHGLGTNAVPRPCVPCAFCQGTGSFQTFGCPVCRGTGAVAPPPGPTRRCEECRGRAFDPRCGLPCLRCRGRGVVTAHAPPPEPPSAAPFLEATQAEAVLAP